MHERRPEGGTSSEAVAGMIHNVEWCLTSLNCSRSWQDDIVADVTKVSTAALDKKARHTKTVPRRGTYSCCALFELCGSVRVLGPSCWLMMSRPKKKNFYLIYS